MYRITQKLVLFKLQYHTKACFVYTTVFWKKNYNNGWFRRIKFWKFHVLYLIVIVTQKENLSAWIDQICWLYHYLNYECLKYEFYIVSMLWLKTLFDTETTFCSFLKGMGNIFNICRKFFLENLFFVVNLCRKLNYLSNDTKFEAFLATIWRVEFMWLFTEK